jgi:NTE family protein
MLKHAPKTGPRIGLALGAGGARGFAHIPVLEAFDELGLKPVAVSGASIGAVIGAGYCAGMSGADIRDYVHELFRRRSDLVTRLWRTRPKSAREFFTAGGVRFGQFDAERLLNAFLPESIPTDFADLDIPLKVVASDFYGWKASVLEEGDLRKAIAASIAIPVVFRPVLIEGRVMVDGTVFNPVPFDIVAPHTDIVVAVDVIGGPTGPASRMPTPVEAVLGTTQLLMRAILNQKLRQANAPQILVKPAISGFRLLDMMKANTILKAAEPVKDEVKRALDKAIARHAAALTG